MLSLNALCNICAKFSPMIAGFSTPDGVDHFAGTLGGGSVWPRGAAVSGVCLAVGAGGG